jgi:electron transport complex protein RnfA
LSSVVNGFATALGYGLAMILMAGLREKLEFNDIPKSFQGMPMVLLTAMLMSIAFFGFSGLFDERS